MPDLPAWQPLDEVAPPATPGSGVGRVVAMVATEGAVASGWAASAALDLARSWSQSGHRVMLVDGGLQHPTLHTAAGLPNADGLSDTTLYGASVGHVSRPLDDGKFFLITAGTAVADTDTVVRSGRWHRLSAGFSEAGVTLVLFVRDGEKGAVAFLGSASDVVVLASPNDPPPMAVRDLEPLVRAVAGPGAGQVSGSVFDGGGRPESRSHNTDAKPEGWPRRVLLAVLLVILAMAVAYALGMLISSLSPAAGGAALQDSVSRLASVAG